MAAKHRTSPPRRRDYSLWLLAAAALLWMIASMIGQKFGREIYFSWLLYLFDFGAVAFVALGFWLHSQGRKVWPNYLPGIVAAIVLAGLGMGAHDWAKDRGIVERCDREYDARTLFGRCY